MAAIIGFAPESTLDPRFDVMDVDIDGLTDDDCEAWLAAFEVSLDEVSLDEVSLDEAVADADDSASAPSVSTMVSLLCVDPDRLGADAALDYLIALHRHASWLATLESRALVAAAGPHTVERSVEILQRDPLAPVRTFTVIDEARDEIAAALHQTASRTHDDIERARLLHGPMRRTRDALAQARLGVDQAKAILRRVERMSGRLVTTGQAPDADTPAERAERKAFIDRCETFQNRLLSRAAVATPAQVGAMADRALAAIDREAAAARREAAKADIDVRIGPDTDGLAFLFARLDLLDGARLAAAIDARAADPDLPGPCHMTAGQRRVAALMDLACGRTSASRSASTGDQGAAGVEGRAHVQVSAHIDVVIDLATLLGLRDDPAELRGPGADGGTPIDTTALRELMADPSVGVMIRRLVTDPLTGDLLDRGRRAYAVPDALRDFIATRDGTCRFPGCRRRASTCQIDHAEPWEDGGRTDRDNLGALCVRHHQLKTHAGWDIIDSRADGSCTWRSPLGRVYSERSPGILGPPLTTPDPDPPPF